jgi:hypothetical protein
MLLDGHNSIQVYGLFVNVGELDTLANCFMWMKKPPCGAPPVKKTTGTGLNIGSLRMPILHRRKIDTEIEKRIVTGMIVSSQYMKEIYPLIDLAYFQNSYTQKIAAWCIDYYEYYESTPFDTIQDIFENETPSLSEEDAELIRTLLSDISKKYQVEEGINVPYLVDRTEEFCKMRELEITAGNIQVLLKKGDLAGAEKQIDSFRKVQRITSDWVNPFDEEEVYEVFEDAGSEFFKFPGVLGDMLGEFERGWLIGISGPFKAGKTWLAMEFAVIAILSGLRVAFFSLEMTNRQIKERFYKRFTAAGKKEDDYIYPIFDCYKNQDGSCSLERRSQSLSLMDAEGTVPEYDQENPYRPCTACRDLPNRPRFYEARREYEATTWYETLYRPELSPYEAERAMSGFRTQYGDLFRVKSYPRFSANIADIKRDLDLLEHTDEFIPDVIIVDYADILKPEDTATSGIEKEDRSWIALAQIAMERHALVVAPTQVKIDALEANIIKVTHMARWVGKLGHVDVMLTHNQKEEEKRIGKARIGVIAHRHKEFHPGFTVTILQQLKLGQPNLDSEIVIERRREENNETN